MAITLPPLVDAFFTEVVHKHAPEARVRNKSEWWLNRFISWIVKPFNPNFSNGYITTIGTTIWVPDGWVEASDEMSVLDVMAHETQHIIDLKKYGTVGWTLIYGTPQVLAVLSLLAFGAFWNAWWLLWLLCLGFLAPLPSPGRYMGEKNGYRTSVIFARKVHGYTPEQMEQLYDWVEEQLSGRWYYFAWPFPKAIENDLRDESFMKEPRYKELVDFLDRHGLSQTTKP